MAYIQYITDKYVINFKITIGKIWTENCKSINSLFDFKHYTYEICSISNEYLGMDTSCSIIKMIK